MSLFEFIMSMISLMIALAIAQLLVGAGRLVQHPGKVRVHVPHLLWILVVFLLAFLHWWSLWDFRDLDWNWAMFFYSLLGPTALFFAATVLSPASPPEGALDLRMHFRGVRRVFLLSLLVAMVFMTLDGPLFGTEDPVNLLRWLQAVLVVCVVVALVSDRDSVQTILAALVLAVLVGGAVFRFFPGGFIWER